MTDLPAHDLEHSARGVARLIDRYARPSNQALLASWLDEVQEAEDALWQLYVERSLATAEGDQLDVLGAIVGEPRLGRDDETYRLWISARNMVNRSSGMTTEMLAIARKLIPPPPYYIELTEYYPAAFVMHIVGALTLADGYQIARMLHLAKGAGIQFGMTWTVVGDGDTFTFAPADAVVPASDMGFDAGVWAAVADGTYVPPEEPPLPFGAIVIGGVPIVIDGSYLVITGGAAALAARPARTPVTVAKSAKLVPHAAAPLAAPAPFTTTIELEDAFSDISLEMDAEGDQFRVAAALQSTIAAAAEDAEDALAAAAIAGGAASDAQADADAANIAAAAAQADADAAAAAAAVAQATANTALSAAGAASAAPPYVGPLVAPASPNAWNDEFDSGSADLVARGWTIQIEGTGVVPTRVGPFDPTAAALTTGQYRSSIVGSKLLLQIANPVFISKPLSASCALAARVGAMASVVGTNAFGVGVSSVQRNTDGTNRFLHAWNQGNQAKMLEYNAGAYNNRGTVTTIALLDAYDVAWFTFTRGGTTLTAAEARHISAYSGSVLSSVFSGSLTFASVYGGLYLTGGPSWYEIDYIRQYAAGAFFPP